MLVLAAMFCALGPVTVLHGVGRQPKKTNGAYQVTVAGYYAGTGTLTVRGKKVAIQATVEPADGKGAKLKFIASNLALNGDHFTGTATIQGAQVNIRGRLDGYAGDPVFHGARCLCSYTDGGTHAGQIAGVLQ